MIDISLKKYNETYLYVECDDSTFYELRDHFSFEADGFRFNPKYKMKMWDGRIRLLEHNHLLPFGLYKEVIKFAEDREYSLDIESSITEQDEITKEELQQWIDSKDIYSKGNKIKPYWYQVDSIFNAIKNKRAILNLPTSAGKSLVQCLLTRYYLENFEGKVLILVPSVSLVTQMKSDFVDYKLFPADAIAEIRAGKSAKDELIIVSTWQSAIKQNKEWLNQFGMILCDEMHLSTGMSITKIIKGLENCTYKIGLTGTLKDGKANLMQYIGMFGDVFKPTTTAQLMEEGQAANLKINTILLNYSDKSKKVMNDNRKALSTQKVKIYQNEIKLINSSNQKTKFIVDLSNKLAARNENAFVMFKHIEHGKKVYQALLDSGITAYYVDGDIKVKERDELKTLIEDNKGIVIVASYGVFSTGISVKNLHHVILAHPVKSKVTVLQTIGRLLRLHGSKDVATVWDLIDDFSDIKIYKNGTKKRVNINYSLQHGLERIERYASEKFNYVLKKVNLF